MGLLERIFGDWNAKEIKRIEKIVDQIEGLDKAMEALSDQELRDKTDSFRQRLAQGHTLEDLLPEAFAVCREAAVRSLGMKHFRVQLIGGVVLHEGNIAEMKTGEGKTLAATLPVYLNALAGQGVHVVTVNDYLARRDMEWMGKLYTFLGLSVGCIVHGISKEERREAYLADVTYGTNNEFGFDYLRDNMVIYRDDQMQRPLHYAIVDEVDSILIDEARTPLIISGQGTKSTELYALADRFVRGLSREEDFTVEEKERTVSITEAGVAKSEAYFHIENFSDPENMEINHHVQIALKAHNLMTRDVDYIEKDGEIVIVDEFTGRLMFGRRYSDGLHQAIEAKEGIEVRMESKTLATITLQNYFRMYQKLAGMTGTAKTEENEFTDIYNMQVVAIPTNMPVIRDDQEDSIYTSASGKFGAIVEEIVRIHESGRPILVGTISIEKSELLSDLLKKRGVRHKVLNAKQHQREAEIVAEAGRLGAVTIATNMAGRGTDIILGGNPDFEAKKEMRKQGFEEEAISYASSFVPLEDGELIRARETYHRLLEQFTAERAQEQEEVRRLGGLHIVGTERHEARRIDNQLRGRAGRQGDPGSTRFFLAMDDELMRLFGGERMQNIIGRLGVEEGEAIEAGLLTKSIENAQKKVEGRNYGIRKYVLQYDDVMNHQRSIIYSQRNLVLAGEDLREHIVHMIQGMAEALSETCQAASKYPEEWDFDELNRRIQAVTGRPDQLRYEEEALRSLDGPALTQAVEELFLAVYRDKEEEIGSERMRELERMILLRIVDNKWMDHIDAMDQLKSGIGLRSLGQQDPAAAYANEAFAMFEDMIQAINEEMVYFCFNVTLQTGTQRRAVFGSGEGHKEEAVSALSQEGEGGPGDVVYTVSGGLHGDVSEAAGRPAQAPRQAKPQPVKVQKKPGRNDPCPCGSGKKYKNCCGSN